MKLKGKVPSAIKVPAGCRFHPRCKYATEKCKTKEPTLIDKDGHLAACHYEIEALTEKRICESERLIIGRNFTERICELMFGRTTLELSDKGPRSLAEFRSLVNGHSVFWIAYDLFEFSH